MESLSIHDVLQLGGSGVFLLVAVMVIRRDIHWLTREFREHKDEDNRRFELERTERHDLMDDQQEDRNRITALEARAGMHHR